MLKFLGGHRALPLRTSPLINTSEHSMAPHCEKLPEVVSCTEFTAASGLLGSARPGGTAATAIFCFSTDKTEQGHRPFLSRRPMAELYASEFWRH
jgi:hypothetical protein